MSTIPILKPFHLANLPNQFPDIKVVTTEPQLVNIKIAGATAHAYRVDLAAEDNMGKIWNVFVYVNDAQTFLFGMDMNAGSIHRTRDYESTYDSVFAPLISHFDNRMEPPRFGDPAQMLEYPEMLSHTSFYVEDVLYVSTRSMQGPHLDSGATVSPPRFYEPRVDANDEETYPFYALYESQGFLKLLTIE